MIRHIGMLIQVAGLITAQSQEATPQVPPAAPDSLPAGLYDESNVRFGSACVTGPMLRGIVVVIFQQGATQAERQEAVDLVNGVVIGGVHAVEELEGSYYVRVEDDPDGQILCDAVEALNALPQVLFAGEELFGFPDQRKPDDGGLRGGTPPPMSRSRPSRRTPRGVSPETSEGGSPLPRTDPPGRPPGATPPTAPPAAP